MLFVHFTSCIKSFTFSLKSHAGSPCGQGPWKVFPIFTWAMGMEWFIFGNAFSTFKCFIVKPNDNQKAIMKGIGKMKSENIVFSFINVYPSIFIHCRNTIPLHWRHNEHDGVSNYRRLNCLLNRLFRCRAKKTSKLHVTGLLCGEFTCHQWIPLTKASDVELCCFL